MNYRKMPINIIALLEKCTRLHGGKGYLTTVRVIARCNGSFFECKRYLDNFILYISDLHMPDRMLK